MDQKLKANPDIVLRTEYDDWGVLFDPDTGKAGGISPTAVFIWQKLDGSRTRGQILAELAEACEDELPETAAADYDEFIAELQEKGYVSV
ncbi:MAG: PqqD family peptide modification chaperone [Desulfobacterales bacterium]|nr:PqqD family peptide modification chaperone [Desulfobacterales bacterium]